MINKPKIFCKRLNKFSRYGDHKLIPKRLSLIKEFRAIPCSFNHSKFRINDTIIQLNEQGVYEVIK